jgi:hypothetical protein
LVENFLSVPRSEIVDRFDRIVCFEGGAFFFPRIALFRGYIISLSIILIMIDRHLQHPIVPGIPRISGLKILFLAFTDIFEWDFCPGGNWSPSIAPGAA